MSRGFPENLGQRLVAIPVSRGAPTTPVVDIDGETLDGAPLTVALCGVDAWTLLLFLAADCDGCADSWGAASEPARFGVDAVVVVTKDGMPASWAEDGTDPRVIRSPQAWSAFRVTGPPFFVLTHGSSPRVVSEGVAVGVGQIAGHVATARTRFEP